jgi:hypothetical protein
MPAGLAQENSMRKILVGCAVVAAACLGGTLAPPLPPWLDPREVEGSWTLRLRSEAAFCNGLDSTHTLWLDIRRATVDGEHRAIVLAGDSNTWQDSATGRTGLVGGRVTVFAGDSTADVAWLLSDTTGSAQVSALMRPDLSVRGVFRDPWRNEYGPPSPPVFGLQCAYALDGYHH